MSTAVIPAPIAELQHQLDEFRSTQPRLRKLPESLWQVAVELAREHGVYAVAHPLRLDYMGLKKLWFAKISSQAKSLRISNIQISVHGREAYEDEACNIVTWTFGGAFEDQTELSVKTGFFQAA